VLVTIGSDMAARLWDGDTGRQIGEGIGMVDDMPRVAPVPASDAMRHLLVSGDFMVRRVDPLTGARRVITRWETADGQPRDEFSNGMEEISALTVEGRDLAYITSMTHLWRIDAHTGVPV
jgi:hypothetical protein